MLIAFLLVSIKWITRNHWRRSNFEFSKIVPTSTPIIIARSASVANPMKRAGVGFYVRIAASRAHDEFRPAMLGQIPLARIFIRKYPLKIADAHLMDRLTRRLASSDLEPKASLPHSPSAQAALGPEARLLVS